MAPVAELETWSIPRRKRRAAGACLVIAVLMFALPSRHSEAAPPARELVVTVAATEPASGSAAGKGDAQVASLAEAVIIARRWRKAHGTEARIAIELEPGRHRLTEPVVLGPEDSGGWSTPLVIRGGRGGGRSELTGAVALSPAGDLTRHPRAGDVPAHIRGRVRRFRLPAQLARSSRVEQPRFHAIAAVPAAFEIFDELGAMRLARWPNEGWAHTAAVASPDNSLALEGPSGPVDRFQAWTGERDLWLAGYPRYDWSYETLGIAAVDAQRGRLVVADKPRYGLANGRRVAVVHALAELDEPGEWYRDAAAGEILLLARTGGGEIEASVASGALELRGASHIAIRDLSLTRFRGDAITAERGAGVVVERVRISWIAGRAVVFRHAQASGVSAAHIEATGEGGVVLEGGDRAGLSSGRQFVIDSTFADFSRLGFSYKPAIDIAGVGARVLGNVITDAPHMAIRFAGNDHEISENVIARVVMDADDAGAVYTGRDWTARGTVLRANVFCDIRARPGFEVKGIYLDDFASGVRVEGNLFVRVDQPIFIGGGRDNTVVANVLIDSAPGVHVDARGLGWARASIDDPASELRRSLAAVPLVSAIWRGRYPALAGLLADEPHLPKGNVLADNVMVGGGETVRLQQVPPGLVETSARAARRTGAARDQSVGAIASVVRSTLQPGSPGYDPLLRLLSQSGTHGACRNR